MKLKRSCCWKVTLIFLCVAVTAEGAIQCYCNREECQNTYTCISHTEKCYSKLYTVYSHENKTTPSSKDEHGCIDLVRSEGRHSTLCDSSGDVVKQLKEREPLIMCCSDNMCNYRKSQDINVDIIDNPVHSTDPVISQGNTKDEQTISIEKDNNIIETPAVEDEDVMFRAAVIAVPIAGGLILVILILMAVRMLREDYRRSDSQHRLLKAHSFIEQHFVKKDIKKPSQSKRFYSNNIRENNALTAVHHGTHSSQNGQFSTGDHLNTDNVNASEDSKPSVCVSLLPADKQSNLSIV